jgi:hypothetical protein
MFLLRGYKEGHSQMDLNPETKSQPIVSTKTEAELKVHQTQRGEREKLGLKG